MVFSFQVRRLLVNIIDPTHADLFFQLRSVALMSHIDARQLGSQQKAARIGRLELQLEDIGMMQRLNDLRTVCGPRAPSSTQFGVCLTMRIHVHCSMEVVMQWLRQLDLQCSVVETKKKTISRTTCIGQDLIARGSSLFKCVRFKFNDLFGRLWSICYRAFRENWWPMEK